jgi:hypothetical protein
MYVFFWLGNPHTLNFFSIALSNFLSRKKFPKSSFINVFLSPPLQLSLAHLMEEPTVEDDDDKPVDYGSGGNKRSFAEMATQDLSRVFFQTISKKVIVDAMPRVRELQNRELRLREIIRNYQTICPPCVIDTNLQPW